MKDGLGAYMVRQPGASSGRGGLKQVSVGPISAPDLSDPVSHLGPQPPPKTGRL